MFPSLGLSIIILTLCNLEKSAENFMKRLLQQFFKATSIKSDTIVDAKKFSMPSAAVKSATIGDVKKPSGNFIFIRNAQEKMDYRQL